MAPTVLKTLKILFLQLVGEHEKMSVSVHNFGYFKALFQHLADFRVVIGNWTPQINRTWRTYKSNQRQLKKSTY